MKQTRLMLATVLLLGAGCARPGGDESAPRNIFGADERVDVPHPTGVLRTVGRTDGGCSATLVGQNLLLTAAHCIEDNTGVVKPNGFVARFDFDGGVAQTTARVKRAWFGTYNPEDKRDADWAILELDAAIGAGRWTRVDGAALTDATLLPFTVSAAGYSLDRGSGNMLTLHKGCQIRERGEGGRLLEDCDSAPGISGGPLLRDVDGDAAVVAIIVSEYRQNQPNTVHRDVYSADYANAAIPASAFAATLASLKATVERGLPAPALDGVLKREAPPLPNQPGDTPASNRLADYQWKGLFSVPVQAAYGYNSFDIALGAPLGVTPLRVAFAGSCGPIDNIQLAAITQPEANVWEAGRMFEGVGAHFTSGQIRFLRVSFYNRGYPQRCSMDVLTAKTAAAPTGTIGNPPQPTGQGLSYCQAAPYDDPRISYYYWYHQSMDYARYQALAKCTNTYGYVCSVTCRAPG